MSDETGKGGWWWGVAPVLMVLYVLGIGPVNVYLERKANR
jgi:hypothetical protein